MFYRPFFRCQLPSRLRCAIALLSLLIGTNSSAQVREWPQFRGPTGQGVVEDVTLPTEWDESNGVVWKVDIPGLGHSSPVHDGDTIWVTTATEDGSILGAVSVDARTGSIIKNLTIFEPESIEEIHHDNSYASPTPVLSEGKLFVHFGTYGTACIDCQSGRKLWERTDLLVEHQGGPGSSPVLYEDLLIITLDGAQEQKLVALDTADGSTRWTRNRSAPFRTNPITHRAFSTPLICETNGEQQLISAGADQCHAYSPEDGRELWHIRYTGFSNVPRPVVVGDTVFICTGFFQPEIWAVPTNGTGELARANRIWSHKSSVPDTPSPVVVDSVDVSMIVMVSNKGIVTALDASTGKQAWKLRIGGNFSSSPISAGGLLYFCSEEGVTKIVDPHQSKPRVIQANRLPGRIMASPVVIDQDLLLRTDNSLYRISSQGVR
ncbi:outer membrane biogenesis protein BamB [Thalassoglobus neptunius]|uniref:Outer membrane biogenesis protein BamB n=1 Tax=Thalassoglobus neptunius TaxID=1938619 RepID=A0A5C5X5I8_9PLAN|nr:PQQ-binding-like beta-propeller repeat protein [Thalassoglobus neptunius]TWT58018.1 outer membrane biogenesis protein BamB [Thalassoglobus neptunius]